MVSTSKRLEQIALIVAASALAVGTFLVLKPFLASILWALILALVTWPAFTWLTKHLNNRKQLAASILVSFYLLIMVIPVVLLGWSLADNVIDAYQTVTNAIDKGLPNPPAWLKDIPFIGNWLDQQWQELSDSRSYFLSFIKTIALHSKNFFLAGTTYTGQAIFYFLLSIFLKEKLIL